MKKLTNLYIVAIMGAGALLSSCQKGFDPASYAPPLNIGGFTSANEIASDSLIAYWSFNGTLKDSISGIEGTATGSTFSAGVKGNAMQNATNQYVVSNTPDAVQNMKAFTVASWVFAAQNTSGIVGVVDIANSTEFWGNLTIFFENGSTETKGVLKVHVRNDTKEAWLGNYDVTNPWNKWTHIAVTYDGVSKFVIYVNGQKLAEQTVADFGQINFKNAGKMVFGTVHFQTTPSLTSSTGKQDWASYLNGRVDEVRIYKGALSAKQISSLMLLEGRGK